jgi:hypothetical protein
MATGSVAARLARLERRVRQHDEGPVPVARLIAALGTPDEPAVLAAVARHGTTGSLARLIAEAEAERLREDAENAQRTE